MNTVLDAKNVTKGEWVDPGTVLTGEWADIEPVLEGLPDLSIVSTGEGRTERVLQHFDRSWFECGLRQAVRADSIARDGDVLIVRVGGRE